MRFRIPRHWSDNSAALAASNKSLKGIIDALGLTSSLVLCLDAGALTSTNGVSQTWSDISGQGNHFYRGTSSSSESSDPVFNGTGGNLSANEYFFNNNGGLFSQTASQTFAYEWHKANAVFTIVAIAYSPNTGALRLFENIGAPGPGVDFYLADRVNFEVNDGGSTVFQPIPSATLTTPGWNYAAIAMAEPTSCFIQTNASTQTLAGSYSNTVPANPGGPNRLFLNAVKFGRLGGLMAWNRTLSSTELANLRTEVKKRWTTLP